MREFDPAELRKRIGVVLQDVFLFAGTVRENLSLDDASIPDATLLAAARAVQAERIVEGLGGLSAAVMERGVTLSAGERQLLSFARTLAHDPAVLVLDEATASIDTESERLVQLALARLLEGRTSLIIAHRLSTIRKADRILVLHHGVARRAGHARGAAREERPLRPPSPPSVQGVRPSVARPLYPRDQGPRVGRGPLLHVRERLRERTTVS